MAESDSTLGYRFAESLFLAKTYKPHLIDQFMINNEPADYAVSAVGLHISRQPGKFPRSHTAVDETLAELMETLRQHINGVLRLSVPVQKRSRLVASYWELEFLVEELRRLVDSEESCVSPTDESSAELYSKSP